MAGPKQFSSTAAAFFGGIRHALTSVYVLVMAGTFIGVGALGHDFGFSAAWVAVSTVLIWAAPAQVILITSVGAGAPVVEAAIAVTLSGIRLFPMVVALLPLLRGAGRRFTTLLVPAHFTSISMWIESLRVLPGMDSQWRLAFCNGLSVGYMSVAVVFGFVGFYLAAGLPPLFAAALLFLTPMSFLISTARTAIAMIDRLALVLGLLIGPVLVWQQVELDLMWTGVAGGSIAYGVHRLRRRAS
jgi:predicted branched-subunit amino acid permease